MISLLYHHIMASDVVVAAVICGLSGLLPNSGLPEEVCLETVLMLDDVILVDLRILVGKSLWHA